MDSLNRQTEENQYIKFVIALSIFLPPAQRANKSTTKYGFQLCRNLRIEFVKLVHKMEVRKGFKHYNRILIKVGTSVVTQVSYDTDSQLSPLA